MTSKRTPIVVATAIAGLALGGGAAYTQASGGEGNRGDGGRADDSGPITGPDLQRAKRVALRHTHGGQVTDTELRDEEGYYEVEVGREGGGQVDVHLDRSFRVIDASRDGSSGDGSR